MLILAALRCALATPVAITLDDLPLVGGVGPGDTREQAIGRIVTTLRDFAAPATGFVECRNIQSDAELDRWQSVELANHSTSHRSVDDLGKKKFVADVLACGERLSERAPVRYFRYPYLMAGQTPRLRDAVVEALDGTTIAPVTIDTSDWAIDAPYVQALRANDAALAERIGHVYVDHVLAAARHHRAYARDKVGRDVAHVLLLHANALAADHLDEVLQALADDGFTFVSLSEALADPIYAMPDDYAGPIGMSWLYHLAPADPEAWAFDHGEEVAIETRYGDTLPTKPVPIGDDLTVRFLQRDVVVVTDEEPYPANTLLVALDDGFLVVVGSPYTAAATEALLTWARVRFGERPIIAIGTHFHGDGGTAGNATYRRWGAAAYTSDRGVALLASRGSEIHQSLVDGVEDPKVRAAVDATPWTAGNQVFPLETPLSLVDGQIEVLFPGAGHSPDNVVAFFPRLGVLFGGCMVRVDALGNLSDADLAAWPAAIARLQELHPTIVIPGHGDEFGPDLLDRTAALLR